MDAAENPVVRKSKREINTGDLEIAQRAAVNLDVPRDNESLVSVEGHLDQSEIEALAFMEEPITIVLNPSTEKNAAKVVDCWVNGRGAEQLQNGKWMVCGWLPVGHPVTTKRKYAEVLARAKPETITTDVKKYEDREDNLAFRTAYSKYPFSVLHDSNPRGTEWLVKILSDY